MASGTAPVLMWFRDDLRVADNPALADAAARGPVIGLFCVCRTQWQRHGEGPARQAFVLGCLAELSGALARRGIPLLIVAADTFAGSVAAVLEVLATQRCAALYFNNEYPLNERRRDAAVAARVRAAGVDVVRWDGGVIASPGSVLTGSGGPYTVFTPFRRRWLSQHTPAELVPVEAPPVQDSTGLPNASALPVPRHPHLAGWPPGEREAQRRLRAFVESGLDGYATQRDLPALDGTSGLSPYLAAGAISARQCVAAAAAANHGVLHDGRPGADTWITELIWRDFYRHLLAAFDRLSTGHNFRAQFDALPWRVAPDELAAWRDGRTGIPIIDAAQRQLLQRGWMHNRLRMLTASFLSKHLLLDWRLGEAHFMAHLVDGDLAANNGGWQWAASTGTDAQPYFRIFNPVTQGKRFDPDAAFVLRYVPELAGCNPRYLHEPWRAGGHSGYPAPIVDLAAGRARALAVFEAVHAAGSEQG